MTLSVQLTCTVVQVSVGDFKCSADMHCLQVSVGDFKCSADMRCCTGFCW